MIEQRHHLILVVLLNIIFCLSCTTSTNVIRQKNNKSHKNSFIIEKDLILKKKLSKVNKSQVKAKCKQIPKPEWVKQFQQNLVIDDKFYYGINYAIFINKNFDLQTVELARNHAIDDLSFFLSTSVKSSFKEYLSNYDEDKIQSSIIVSTRLVLSGIKISKQWTDCINKVHWVMVSIDRKQADKQIREQRFINEVAERLEKKQNEIKSGMKIFSEVLERKMISFETHIKRLENLSNTIDTKISSAGKQSETEYKVICKQIEKLRQDFNQQQNELKQSYNKRTNALIEQNSMLYSALQQLSKRINKDYFLNYIDNDNSRKYSAFQISIEPLKGQGADYYEGERIKFRVTTTMDCYIKVFYISSDGKEIMLLPNLYDQDNRLLAGQKKIIGRKGELIVHSPFGKDVVSVSASITQFTDIEEKLQILRTNKENPYYTRNLQNPLDDVKTRSIGISKPKYFDTDTCYIVSHKNK